MQNSNLLNKDKIGYICKNKTLYQYAILGSIVIITDYENNDSSVKIVTYNINKINNRDIDDSIIQSIETTNIPIYLLSKNNIFKFVQLNHMYIQEEIKEEVYDILEDFNGLSYKDFINAIFGDLEYDELVSSTFKRIVVSMKENNITPYCINPFIKNTIEVIKTIIK